MAQTGIIPRAWFDVTGCWSAKPLLALLAEVDRHGIDHRNREAVSNLWQEMNAQATKEAEDMHRRIEERAHAARLDQQRREDLGLTFPALRNKLRVKL